jgi:RIO kinase 1
MVRTWAEKEMRNLKRLTVAGIPCPEPHLLKQHVLIMDFLGEDGWCAPRLREVTLTQEELTVAYASIVIDMRRMYHECNLVHGDLSEYNLLWHRGRAVIIDVSQSVENAHPMANDFLRMDINNINDYFKKREVQTLSNFRLFQFITSAKLLSSTTLEHSEMMAALSLKLTEMIGAQEVEDARCMNEEEENEEEVANAVFLQSYIPSSLSEINNPQAESAKLRQGGQREKIYEMAVQRMLGGPETESADGDGDDVSRLPNAIEQMKLQSLQEAVGDSDDDSGDEDGDEEEEEDEDEEDDDDEDDDDEDERDENGKFLHKKKKSSKYRRRLTDKGNEEERLKQKEAKKEAKKSAKEQAALKRTKKIPKHVKKRATKKEKK